MSSASRVLETQCRDEVEILAKVIEPMNAGRFTYRMAVHTDIIGGTVLNTKYATEEVTVDPLAEPEDDCLVIAQFPGGMPHMTRWRRTGKDFNGRFVRKGAESEAFRLNWGIVYSKADLGKHIYIHGCVVGFPREFPRSPPSSYRTIDSKTTAQS